MHIGFAALIALTVLHLVLLAVPIGAGALLAVRFGIRNLVLVYGAGLVVLAAAGYGTFWAYYFAPRQGRWIALAITVGLAMLGLAAWAKSRDRIGVLRPLAVPSALVGTYALAILALGAAPGWTGNPVKSAMYRFSPFPGGDNQLPMLLARAVTSTHRPLPSPFYAHWLPSDRPPLQAGIYLLQVGTLGAPDSSLVHYQIVGVLLQSLWIPAAWLLAHALFRSRAAASWALAATLFSGFVVFNTYFVWPKMLAAAYLLLLAAFALTGEFAQLRASPVGGVILGGLVAAAVLAHEGSGIAVAGLAVTMVLCGRIPRLRVLAAGTVVVAALMAPWMLYQKVVDPPGDNLSRLQLAGAPFLHSNTSLPALITDAYRPLSAGEIACAKVHNLLTPFSGVPDLVTALDNLATGHRGGIPVVSRKPLPQRPPGHAPCTEHFTHEVNV